MMGASAGLYLYLVDIKAGVVLNAGSIFKMTIKEKMTPFNNGRPAIVVKEIFVLDINGPIL